MSGGPTKRDAPASMWNTVTWILQGVLALVFLFHGILYALGPEPLVRSMREHGKWPPAIPPWFRIFIGIAELLAVVGLILPGLLHVFTLLTPLAAAERSPWFQLSDPCCFWQPSWPSCVGRWPRSDVSSGGSAAAASRGGRLRLP